MKIHSEIEQRSEDWHRIKWGKIGGSSASELWGKVEAIFYRLMAEHTEDFEQDEDGFISSDMQRGIELEPEAMKALEQFTGKKFLIPGWVQSECSIIGISPDGITECGKFMAEIKCPGRVRHMVTVLLDEIPADNLPQCVHYFTVNPSLQVLYFVSFRPESIRPLYVKELRRNDIITIGKKQMTVSGAATYALLTAKDLERRIKSKIEKLKNQF